MLLTLAGLRLTGLRVLSGPDSPVLEIPRLFLAAPDPARPLQPGGRDPRPRRRPLLLRRGRALGRDSRRRSAAGGARHPRRRRPLGTAAGAAHRARGAVGRGGGPAARLRGCRGARRCRGRPRCRPRRWPRLPPARRARSVWRRASARRVFSPRAASGRSGSPPRRRSPPPRWPRSARRLASPCRPRRGSMSRCAAASRSAGRCASSSSALPPPRPRRPPPSPSPAAPARGLRARWRSPASISTPCAPPPPLRPRAPPPRHHGRSG